MGLISNILRERIGTDKWKHIPIESTLLPLLSTEEISRAKNLQDIHKTPGVVNDLEEVRNKYALRLTKGIAPKILEHKNVNAIVSWLEVKPLFISGVIFSDVNKFPYLKLANFLKISERQIRRHCSTWRKMKLAKFDQDKNLHLASYGRLNEILKHNCNRKHKLLNNGKTKSIVRQYAIHENLKRQEFIRNRKIVSKVSGNLFDAISTSHHPVNSKEGQIAQCGQKISRNRIRKTKAAILKEINFHVEYYKNIYDQQMNQIEFGKPGLNPYVTLSCKGIAKACGLSSVSAGYNISVQLEKLGYLVVKKQHLRIDKCAAVFESNILGIRQDVFSFSYPIRRGNGRTEKKFFRRLPNLLETIPAALNF